MKSFLQFTVYACLISCIWFSHVRCAKQDGDEESQAFSDLEMRELDEAPALPYPPQHYENIGTKNEDVGNFLEAGDAYDILGDHYDNEAFMFQSRAGHMFEIVGSWEKGADCYRKASEHIGMPMIEGGLNKLLEAKRLMFKSAEFYGGAGNHKHAAIMYQRILNLPGRCVTEDELVDVYKKLSSEFELINDIKQAANALRMVLDIFYAKDDDKSIKECCAQLRDLLQRMNSEVDVLEYDHRCAAVQHLKYYPDKAAKSFSRAGKAALHRGQPELAGLSFANAANAFETAKNHKKAGKMHEKAGKCYRSTSVEKSNQESIKAAERYMKYGKKLPLTMKSIDALLKASQIFQKLQSTLKAAYCLNSVGHAYVKLKNDEEAANHFEQAGRLYETVQSWFSAISSYKLALKNYIKLQKRVDIVDAVRAAIKRCEEAKVLSELDNYLTRLQKAPVLNVQVDRHNIIASFVQVLFPEAANHYTRLCNNFISVTFFNEDPHGSDVTGKAFIEFFKAMIQKGTAEEPYFVLSPSGRVYVPNPTKTEDDDLKVYEISGVILALAFHRRVPVPLSIALGVLKQLISKKELDSEDLRDYCPTMLSMIETGTDGDETYAESQVEERLKATLRDAWADKEKQVKSMRFGWSHIIGMGIEEQLTPILLRNLLARPGGSPMKRASIEK